jgi:hypothetical protein
MRVTLDLPDELFRELKSAATRRGISPDEFLRIAVEHELAGPHFPLLESQEPGALNLTNADIEDLLS